MKYIKDVVLRTEKISWRKLKPFQPDNLKMMTHQSFEKLKNSLIKENFVASFKIWNDGEDNYWILDGHHRLYALQELMKDGYEISETFNCEIIDVKNKKHACKLVLAYSSNNARIDELGLSEYIHLNGLDFDDLGLTLDIPGIDLSRLSMANVDIDEISPEGNEKAEKKAIICPNCDHQFIPK